MQPPRNAVEAARLKIRTRAQAGAAVGAGTPIRPRPGALTSRVDPWAGLLFEEGLDPHGVVGFPVTSTWAVRSRVVLPVVTGAPGVRHAERGRDGMVISRE